MNWLARVARRLSGRTGGPGEAAPAAEPGAAPEPAADSRFSDGIAALASGDYEAAVDCFDAMVRARHDDADAHYYLGLAYLKQGKVEDAADCFVLATHFRPAHAEAWYHLALAAQWRDDHAEAARCLERAVASRDDYAEAYNALGASALELGNPQQAAVHFERAVALKPDYAPAHSNLGYVLISEFGNFECGAAHIKTALDLDPGDAGAWCNYCIVTSYQGRLDETISVCDQLLAKKPKLHQARYIRALAKLELGRLAEAWPDYEARKQVLPAFKIRKFPYREWDGSALAGRSLLVYNEQGIGDEILYASCVPDLLALGGQCVVECSAKLAPLFRRSFPAAAIQVANQLQPDMSYLKALPHFDWQIAAGSLALYFRRNLRDFPAHDGYLLADPRRVARWRERFAAMGGGLKVGICWRSSLVKGERALEYTSLSQWGPIFAVPGVHFVNLQYDECGNELEQARSEFGVTLHHFSEVDMLDDLDETAGLMKALDLVISAQTAVSAQAGALGVPCWQISGGADWTALGAEHNPWYPAMKCFRRRWGQPWSGIIERIAGELRRAAPASSGKPQPLNDEAFRARELNERGLIQMENGRHDEAAASFTRAIELQHDFADAHHNLGRACFATGQTADAVDCFYLATHFAPAMAIAHLDLGIALSVLHKTDAAMAALHRAVELDPGLDEAHLRLAGLYKSGGELNQAVAHYRLAADISPASAEVHCNLGYALFRLGRYDDAEAHYMTALRNRKDFADAHHNYGLLFLHRGAPERALVHFETALASKPRLPETVSCIGHALRDLGRYDEALARYDEALAIRPDFGDAVLNRCYIYLALGKCEDGWREYERRFAATDTGKRNFPYPVWRGDDLAGKTILVWGEQGIGDQILFAGLLPEVIRRARRCIIECPAKLVALFARSFAGAQVVAKCDPPHPATGSGIDCQIAAGSLALYFRRNLRDFPAHDGYLLADPRRVARWRERFAAMGGGLKVGICWRSSLVKGERALEYTSLSQWGPIFAVPGVHFVNLQYDECGNELEQARAEFGVTLHHFSEVDMLDDLDETAGLMKALDLVISAQTAVSAQAGALGVPCWQISGGADWTALGAEHNPWYPAMKCFRRRWGQPWSGIIERIAGGLRRVAPARG